MNFDIGDMSQHWQAAATTPDAGSVTRGGRYAASLDLPAGDNTVTVEAADLAVPNARVTSQDYRLSVAGGEGRSYGYDANGNCTGHTGASASRTYEWDAEDRLAAITTSAGGTTLRTEFAYDGFDRRARMVEKVNGMTRDTKSFLWCGSQLCEERDAGGATVTKRFYAEGEQINGQNYYYTRDHLGSIRELTDGLVTVRARYEYEPYGRRTKVSGDVEADFGFTGHYFHGPSGLRLALYRAYDADAGRWISRDPMGEEGGLNLYDYVENNPITWSDSLGLFGDGRKYGPEHDPNSAWRGHSDFYGSQWFDYTAEDHDPDTTPVPALEDAAEGYFGSPQNHFQDLKTSLIQAREAICDNDRVAFERAMHRLQDFYSHYDKGYRWDPTHGRIGHAFDIGHPLNPFPGVTPDHDNEAWLHANRATRTLVNEWVQRNGTPSGLDRPGTYFP